MDTVELGFLEASNAWRLESRFFPSKVGGKPAWLSLKPLPTSEELSCEKCSKTLTFLCQVYAPYDDSKSENNFHRTIFVFVCRTIGCSDPSQSIKVFRSSLARKNDFYSFNPPEEASDSSLFDISKWSEVCRVCGVLAGKKCSQCKNVAYCSKEHQVVDWKNGHKLQCNGIAPQNSNHRNILFPEWELVMETEETEEKSVNEEQALKDYNRLQAEGKTGTLNDISESNLDVYACSETDKTFAKFKKISEHYPNQVIRYQHGGKPLFISQPPSDYEIPNCQYCGCERQFEFQIMPQLLSELKEYELDWGVLLIYTCKDSCIGDSVNHYKMEYVFKQDVI